MTNPTEIQKKFVNEVLQHWAPDVLALLRSKMSKNKMNLTGDLNKSLQYEVLRGASDVAGQLFLAFNESGRIKDMKGVTFRKMPPIKLMEEYVSQIGVSKFKYVPGYSSPSKVPTTQMAINRIAWGIAQGYQKKNKWKPKRWFAKPLYQMINVLIDDLMLKYQDFAIDQTKTEIKKALQG